jgi:putative hydrolase of the HAD superfamily
VILRHALFDLDNTLYPPSSGLWEAIGQRIGRFMVERVGIRPEEVRERRRNYLHAFGTTLSGLRQEFDVDPDDFLSFAHDLPLEKFLRHDLELDAMLDRLPMTKTVFTNADAAHARRVLEHLGVSRHFTHIVDIRALGWINKPDQRAYLRAMELISAWPEECLFADDAARNLVPARALGMLTVLVGGDGECEGADYQVPVVTKIERVL